VTRLTPPLALDRLEARYDTSEHVCYVCCDALPQLLRIARAAQAVVAGVERETLVPVPRLQALAAALEGRS